MYENGNSLKPFVKWAGGKRQLMGLIQEFFPNRYGTYFEVFLGGGIVYFRLKPKKAILTDSNTDLINCYIVVRDQVDKLISAIKWYESKVSDKDYYYEMRDQCLDGMTDIKKAARFIYLNKTCYNGLYRVNREGKFNVPYGKHEKPPRLYDELSLRAVSKILQSAELSACDFECGLRNATRDDFIYFDPPYDRSNNSSFISYSQNGFGRKDQVRLAKVFKSLDRKGCKLLLSNSDTSLVRDLYRDFIIKPVSTKRAINCKGDGRRDFPEVLVVNYDPSD